MDASLVTPFSMGVFASRLSGKSVFTNNLLLQQNRMISTPFKKVIWVYKSWQDELFKQLISQTLFEIDFLDDLPNFDAMGKQENTLIVIDDYMNEASNSAQVQSLFTRGVISVYLSSTLHKTCFTRVNILAISR